MYRYSLSHDEREMCQRLQNSVMVADLYGASKFRGSLKPNSREMPVARSVYPEKSQYICIANAYTPRSAVEPACAADSENIGAVISAPTHLAITQYFIIPLAISAAASPMSSRVITIPSLPICRMKSSFLTSGPSVIFGKKESRRR